MSKVKVCDKCLFVHHSGEPCPYCFPEALGGTTMVITERMPLCAAGGSKMLELNKHLNSARISVEKRLEIKTMVAQLVQGAFEAGVLRGSKK